MRPELPVLIKARAKIADPAKWGKGKRYFDRPVETCCAAEAIEEIATLSTRWFARRRAAFDAFRKAADIPDSWGALTDWNDAPERTHAEVLAAFDKAIASAS
jgi:hypothetical protein